MQTVSEVYYYASPNSSTAPDYFQANTTQYPFPMAAVALLILLFLVGTFTLSKD